MTGYQTRLVTLRFGEHELHVRALADLQQYDDPDGRAERAGISSAQWSLFGHVWPAGRLLARAMSDYPIEGKRILELGCGLGLASLVLQKRGADVLATDHHPLAPEFLAANATLNGLPPVPYRNLDWSEPPPDLGRFDLIIGSDILYERRHAELLAPVFEHHAKDHAEIVIADPGRGNSALMNRVLAAQGYVVEETRAAMAEGEAPPFRGRVLRYRRQLRSIPSISSSQRSDFC